MKLIKSPAKGEVSEKEADDFASFDFVIARMSRVKTKIDQTKFQLILWAFVFWATQLGAMFAFLKFLK